MSAEPTKPKSHWKTTVTVVTLVALLLLIFFLRDQIAEVINNLGRVNTWALLLMIPIQVLNYDAYARLYRHFFKIVGEKVSYKSMYALALELNFVNHILPSGGVSGVSYFSLRMKSFGVNSAKSTLAQVMKFALVFVSFEILLLFGLLSISIMGDVSNFIILVAGMISTLLFVGTGLCLYIIESKSRIRNTLTSFTKALNRLIQVVRRKHPETISVEGAQKVFEELHDNYQVIKKNWRTLKRPFGYALIANITEVLSIYVVFIAFGEYVNIGAVILAYAVANFAGLISILPGGIGVYEALMTGVLAAAGVPPELSIPVIVMYRVVSIAIQLPPGYYFYHRALNGTGFTDRAKS